MYASLQFYLFSSIFLINFHSKSSTRAIYCEARFFVNTYHQLFTAIKFWSTCLWFHKQGNGYAVGVFLAGIPQKTIFWTANRQSSSSCWCQIEFQNWWKYSSAICTKHWDKHYHFSWRCNISIHEGVTSASMLDPGNFVVFNSDNNTIWQSFEHPTNTFLATQHLSDSTLYSSASKSDQSTGIFRLYAVGTALLPENTLTGVLLHMEMEVMWHYALLMMVISTYSIPLAHTSTIWLKEDIQGKIEST